MRLLPTLLAATLLASPLAAQQPGVAAPEAANAQAAAAQRQPTAADVADIRVSQLVIFEGDECPRSPNPNEVTICVTAPAEERFRVPENLRGDPNAPANQSWTNKAIELSYVGRTGIGSCSPVGPGGFTGCNQQLINQAIAERRGRPDVNWARLIEEARQERLGQIDALSAEEERSAEGRTRRRIQELNLQTGQACPPSTELVIIMCNYPPAPGSPRAVPAPANSSQPAPQ
jgi:hypothetical protein